MPSKIQTTRPAAATRAPVKTAVAKPATKPAARAGGSGGGAQAPGPSNAKLKAAEALIKEFEARVRNYHVLRARDKVCRKVTFPNLASRLFFKDGVLIYILLQVGELEVSVSGLETERDFYFGKLRDIENTCQESEYDDNPLVKPLLDIMYATQVCQHVIVHNFSYTLPISCFLLANFACLQPV